MFETAFDLGPHAVFIWSAYAVTAVCMIGLTFGVVASDRRQRQLLADLEARGITRRSAGKAVSETASAKPTTQAKSKSQAKPAPTRRKPAAKSSAAKTAAKAKTASRGSK
jgi:heme exporter protein D